MKTIKVRPMLRFVVIPWVQQRPFARGIGIKDRVADTVHTARKRPHREDYTLKNWNDIARFLNDREERTKRY